MTTMNISLPDSLKAFVDEQVAGGSYSSSSEYMRALIRRDLDRAKLRQMLLDGARAEVDAMADDTFFDGLRERAHGSEPR